MARTNGNQIFDDHNKHYILTRSVIMLVSPITLAKTYSFSDDIQHLREMKLFDIN